MAIDHTPLPVLPIMESRLIGNSALELLTVLVVALRVVTRLVTGSKLGWDDYLILAAVPQGIGILICEGLWSTAGVGYAREEVPAENDTYIAAIFIAFQLTYDLCITTIKLSSLFFHLRVFTHGGMRRATKWMMVLIVVWGLGNLLQSLFVCRVHNGQVDFLSLVRCSGNVPSFVSTGVYNCASNLIINILPLYTIWSLKKVSLSTRFSLTVVFLLGIGVTWVSVIRIVILVKTAKTTELLVVQGKITFLAVLEVNLSIFCNSLPMLLPLYSYWRYRKVYGNEQDEYVSRIRGGHGEPKNHRFAVEGVTNGLPLETIYGNDHVHFTATVARGASACEPGRRESRCWAGGDRSEDEWDAESTRRLRLHRSTTGITIETKWVVTEETKEGHELRD